MKRVKRTAVTIISKQPFINLANSVVDELSSHYRFTPVPAVAWLNKCKLRSWDH